MPVTETPEINFNSILPQGVVLEPLFENDGDYYAFRERFTEEITPVLEKQLEARRRSEEKARRRLLK